MREVHRCATALEIATICGAWPGFPIGSQEAVGHDRINAAAMASVTVLDLGPGYGDAPAGRSLPIAAGTVTKDAFLGDNDDAVIGNAADNRISGGRNNGNRSDGPARSVLTGGTASHTRRWCGHRYGRPSGVGAYPDMTSTCIRAGNPTS